MKKFVILNILALLALLGFQSCEQNVDAELPYKEMLVIRATIQAEKTPITLRLSKTLPPLTSYSDSLAMINNATVVIIGPGDIRYEMKYQAQNDNYYLNITPHSGETYKVEVRYDNLFAYAETTIPDSVLIEKYSLTKTKFKGWNDRYMWDIAVNAEFRPSAKNCYLSGYLSEYYTGEKFRSYQYDLINRIKDTIPGGKLRMPVNIATYEDTSWFNIDNYKGWEGFIESYDQQFYDYYTTRYNGSTDSGIFGTSGENIRWNVKGDGIGVFIGFARSRKLITLE
jgi:hypothetical protein